MEDRELLLQAKKASQNAYAPYSRFPVGAALLGEEGTVFTGCNVENASYGLTLCAERVALVKAVAAGVRRFAALAIWAPVASWPCGACLQSLAEFAPRLRIVRGGDNFEKEVKNLEELFPAAFRFPGQGKAGEKRITGE
ncbi:MAG: cytidine deaminase [Bacillota bacterium]|nr:cytidine deaminase [Bacillota bacterium]